MRLFDTTFLIDLVNDQSGAVEKAKQVDMENDPAAVSVVTVHEYLLGVHLEYREPRRLAEQLESARRDLTPFQVIALTSEIAEESAWLQAWAEHSGRPMGVNDLYIASTATRLSSRW